MTFFGGAGKHYIHLDFYCWFWTSSPSVRAGRWAQEVGKQGQGTFNGAPLGLPSKDSSSINLVLLVTAHHCKRDHFLRKEEKKGSVFLLKTGQETKLASKVLRQAVFRIEFHGMSWSVPDAPEQHCLPETTGSPGPGQQHLLHTCLVQNQSKTSPKPV